MARSRLEKGTKQVCIQLENPTIPSVLASKLDTQNDSNQGSIEELMLHKQQATPCARPNIFAKNVSDDVVNVKRCVHTWITGSESFQFTRLLYSVVFFKVKLQFA